MLHPFVGWSNRYFQKGWNGYINNHSTLVLRIHMNRVMLSDISTYQIFTSVLRIHIDWAKWCRSITLPSLLYRAARTELEDILREKEFKIIANFFALFHTCQWVDNVNTWKVLFVPLWSRSWQRQAITWEGDWAFFFYKRPSHWGGGPPSDSQRSLPKHLLW